MNPRRLVLAVLLALVGPVACSASPELKRVRTPREGVTIAYSLPAGQGFEGQLRVGNTRAVEGLEVPLSQTATCDVTMVVLGSVAEGTEMRATFTSVDLDWDLPPAATYSTDELVELADERLRGMQVRFVVRPDGRIQALPSAPEGTPPELEDVIETLLRGLDAFFVPVPPEPLRRGDEWSDEFSHTTGAGLTQTLEEHRLRLTGSFRHRSDGDELVRLELEQRRREQRAGASGPVTVEREVNGILFFDAQGFPAEVDRETREFDPEQGMVFRKVRASWSRFRGMVPELITPPSGDVQVIEDPCNPDYVGPLHCPEATPPKPEEDEGGAEAGDEAAEGADDEAAAGDGPDDEADEADDDEADDDEADDDA